MTYLTVTEAAEVLRAKPSTIRRYARTGQLRAYQINPHSAYLFDPRDLQAALQPKTVKHDR